MSTENDVCLFAMLTHGTAGKDLWPFDEADHSDEYLAAYDTFKMIPGIGPSTFFRFSFLRDDTLNFYLSKLHAKGVCAIIDACYSGGFNDPPYGKTLTTDSGSQHQQKNTSPATWISDFGTKLSAAPGRVILMACDEDGVSMGNLFFEYLLDGFRGYGDTNNDSHCSAEEAFAYAAPKTQLFVQREISGYQHPQLFDTYPGELIFSDNEMPPGHCQFNGPLTGQTNTDSTFTISSLDPEGDNIRYSVDWNDGTQEWTNLVPSGETATLTHRWATEGTYAIRFKNVDEHGMERFVPGNTDNDVITISDHNSVDQRQTETYEEQCFNDGACTQQLWLAQSFVPTQTKLTKVDLPAVISIPHSTTPQPLRVSIRNTLTGNDLTNITVMPSQLLNTSTYSFNWTTFDFPDITVTPGDTYYIVLRFDGYGAVGGWAFAGVYYTNDPDYGTDPYPQGQPYISYNSGVTWEQDFHIYDFCFVTYGT